MSTSKGRALEARFAEFGGAVLLAEAELPNSKAWRHIRDQLLRSGTAPGAHYSEALGAQSRRDFIYKVALALKEQREALYWLRVVVAARQSPTRTQWLLQEGSELVAILAASLRTARSNQHG